MSEQVITPLEPFAHDKQAIRGALAAMFDRYDIAPDELGGIYMLDASRFDDMTSTLLTELAERIP